MLSLKKVERMALVLAGLRPPEDQPEAREAFRRACMVVLYSAIPQDMHGNFIMGLKFDPRPSHMR